MQHENKLARRGSWVSVICSVVLLMAVISACGGKDNNESSNQPSGTAQSSESAPESSADPYAEHMDISIASWDIGNSFKDPGKDELLQYIQKKFNVTIKPVQVSWSDYQDKTKVWATSGELPDIFVSDFTDDVALYHTWAKQGILHALPDDMSPYPNLDKYLQSSDVKTMTIDGKYYTFPRYTYGTVDGWGTDRALLVRKDWMDKLGLKQPQSYDEFKTLLQAFVQNDPDSNGKKDTVGMEFDNPGYLLYALSSDFPEQANGAWIKQDGKWVPYYQSPKYAETLKRARELYTNDLLDKDFALQKANDARTKFVQGKAGVLALSVYVGHLKALEDMWKQYSPGQNFTDAVGFLPLWPGTDGKKRYHFTTTTFWSESSFNAQMDDKKLDRILRLYDYLLSPDGVKLLMYGLEGKDYTANGDSITITRPKDVSLSTTYPSLSTLSILAAWYQDQTMVDNEINKATYGEANLKLALESKKWIDENTEGIPTNFEVQGLTKLYTVPDLKPQDDMIKTILGKSSIEDMWAKTLKEYDAKGLSKAIEQVNQEAQAKGIQ